MIFEVVEVDVVVVDGPFVRSTNDFGRATCKLTQFPLSRTNDTVVTCKSNY